MIAPTHTYSDYASMPRDKIDLVLVSRLSFVGLQRGGDMCGQIKRWMCLFEREMEEVKGVTFHNALAT